MPKYYCDYCDIFLTHDSPSVRKAHNSGWKHRMHVQNYYAGLEPEVVQQVIDRLQEAFQGHPGAPDWSNPIGQPMGPGPYMNGPPMRPGMPPMGGPMGPGRPPMGGPPFRPGFPPGPGMPPPPFAANGMPPFRPGMPPPPGGFQQPPGPPSPGMYPPRPGFGPPPGGQPPAGWAPPPSGYHPDANGKRAYEGGPDDPSKRSRYE